MNAGHGEFFETTAETTYLDIARSVLRKLITMFELPGDTKVCWRGQYMVADKDQRAIKKVLESTLFYTQQQGPEPTRSWTTLKRERSPQPPKPNRDDVLRALTEMANENGLLTFAKQGRSYGCMLFHGDEEKGFKAIYFPFDTEIADDPSHIRRQRTEVWPPPEPPELRWQNAMNPMNPQYPPA